LLRDAYLAADAIVTASIGVADDLATHAGIPRDRITTVYNPVVAPDLLVKAREPVDHPWFAAGAPPVVLGVGRLHAQKDFTTLLRAFAALRSRRPVRLVILGAGTDSEYAVALKALATELGVAQKPCRSGSPQGVRGDFAAGCCAAAAPGACPARPSDATETMEITAATAPMNVRTRRVIYNLLVPP